MYREELLYLLSLKHSYERACMTESRVDSRMDPKKIAESEHTDENGKGGGGKGGYLMSAVHSPAH
jgi:hypothetical protein